MRCRVLSLLAALTAAAAAVPSGAAASARYDIAGGCYALATSGTVVAKDGTGYKTASSGAEPFHMQAITLGEYLFYGKAPEFMTASGDAVSAAAEPGPAAEWRVDVASKKLVNVVNTSTGKALGVSGGRLVLVDRAAATRFTFERVSGCAAYPESEVNASGTPFKGASETAEVRGLIETHLHGMAYEFLGGEAHCGTPWHEYGIAYAMVDCEDHMVADGNAAVLENILSNGAPNGSHDPVGWPTFADWPHHASLTHEQTYWRWLERAWRGGLRLYTNLLVDNAVLCEVYPYKRNSCNEMDGVRLQMKRLRQFQDYIDAQAGGPGKGFLRIVGDPFEARRVINAGKLAVIPGIEISKLFDCGEYLDTPDAGCDRASIDARLDEVHRMGVRQIEFVNKFDNALSGVAGDGGTTGLVINSGNRYETGHFWDMQTCDLGEHAHDNTQPTAPGVSDAQARDPLVGNILRQFLPGANPILPSYPPGPHCNQRGLTALGAHLLHKIAERQMIFDPDHMSAKARQQALTIMEELQHPGILSSHSWSTLDAYPRILRLGGLITPAGKTAGSWVNEWRQIKALADPRFFFGTGKSTDMNGFAHQGGPPSKPITYPFKSFDGGVTLEKMRSGERVWDYNADGVAHFGMYPDFIEDVRQTGGAAAVEDMARGAEAYLQMWERTTGVDREVCQEASASITSAGVEGIRVGDPAERALKRAGQPASRPGRSFRYCVEGSSSARVGVAMTPGSRVALVGSTGRSYRAGGVSPGDRASAVSGASRFGTGLLVRRAGKGRSFVFGVRGGKVRFVALASRTAMRSERVLRGYLRSAGLR